MAESEVFERFVTGYWEVEGKAKVVFPISRITRTFTNRLAKRKRPYRNGWKVDDTGNDGPQWEIESLIYNGQDEPDIPAAPYPSLVDKLEAALEVHDVGTLMTPTKGPRRCRLESVRRVEDNALRDAAALSMTFTEDNEDNFDAASFAAPSAKAIARSLAQDMVDALQEAGSWDDLVSDFNELAAGLEALANAPGDYAGDIEAKANAITNACERVESAFSSARSEVSDEVTKLLLSPESSRAGRLLRKFGDVAARAKAEVVRKTVSKRYARQVSIFDVAADVGQPASDLLPINGAIPDVLRIAPNTPVMVFEGP